MWQGKRRRHDSSSSTDSSSSSAAPPHDGSGRDEVQPADTATEDTSSSEEGEEGEGEEEEGERGEDLAASGQEIPPSAKRPCLAERGRDQLISNLTAYRKTELKRRHSQGEEGGGSVSGSEETISLGAPLPKKPRVEQQEVPRDDHNYSAMSRRMMASMGYRPGQGLGRSGDGITAPITQSSQLGRRGLGFSVGGLERENVKWEEEEVNIHQRMEWLEGSTQPVPQEVTSWMVEGERKTTITDETHFSSQNTLKSILENKSMFDSLSTKEFLNARQRSNPYETIKGGFFQNRAAMKMANIDSVTGFMFTEPKNEKGAKLGPFDVLYFADICAGPGGFSEYVLWRKKWHAKGFGFTLKDPDCGSDFKLDAFTSPCETFDPHYGVGGYSGDGDITKPENQSEFRNYVMENSEGKGVHFVMADGGISVEGQENIQELLLKQLVLCQYATTLSILRAGGCCVVKVFDMFTPFSVGLFYLLYRCFQRVALFKPVTSRPANSERYVICMGLREESRVIADYLYTINTAVCRHSGTNRDILEVVPLSLMKGDEVFSTYITAFNDSFGMHQIVHLQKIQYFVKNSTLQDSRQADIRRRCLNLWKIPDTPRILNTNLQKPEQVFSEHWQHLYSSKVDAKPRMISDLPCLKSDQFHPVTREGLDFLHSLHSWKWCWACGKRMMVVGLGRNQVFGWEMRGDKAEFSQRPDLSRLELPRGTVLEVEQVQELEGEGSGQRKSDVVYIIDVLAIYNEFIGWKPLKERHLYAEKLAKVLNKPCQRTTVLLRAKTHHRVAELCSQDTFPTLELKLCKGRPWKVPTVAVDNNQSRFLAPVGIIFFRSIKDPWQLHIGSKGFYYFNTADNRSTYDCPPGSVASFLDVLKSRHLWKWERGIFAGLCGEEEEDETGPSLSRRTLSASLSTFRAQR